MDDALVATGRERWSLVAVESATGNFAGWTDLTFNPIKPNVCDVGGTAVSKDYQNLGIGRWLKAAILDKLLKEKPNVEVVRTGNAHSNAPMLKINDELGFMPALTINLWQVEVDKVKEYLAAKSETVSA
jgi:GNAT superfamily N-acetyltransferase